MLALTCSTRAIKRGGDAVKDHTKTRLEHMLLHQIISRFTAFAHPHNLAGPGNKSCLAAVFLWRSQKGRLRSLTQGDKQ